MQPMWMIGQPSSHKVSLFEATMMVKISAVFLCNKKKGYHESRSRWYALNAEGHDSGSAWLLFKGSRAVDRTEDHH